MPEPDFNPIAKFYPWRTPYLRALFPALAEGAGLTNESFVLDLACGTGELAIGLAPYCKQVIGIDRSMDMLSARQTLPANVKLVKAELNIHTIALAEPTDLATIGRAIFYLNPEKVLPFLHASLRPAAGVLVCHSTTDSATPWLAEYKALVDSHGAVDRMDRTGQQFFANSGWVPVRRTQATGTVHLTTEALFFRALSYSTLRNSRILANEKAFREKLRELLKPYCTSEDEVDAEVVSWAIEYRRARNPVSITWS